MTALDDHRTRTPGALPFPTVDEIARHCLQDDEPETVHIEIHVSGRLDPDRLTTAFTRALRRHPRILMREAPRRWYTSRYTWELTDAPDVPPVSFPEPGPNALKAARTRALTESPPLSASPPVRLAAVPHPDSGDTVLFLTINHTALDGPACLRVLATAADLYGGRDNSPPPAASPAPREAP
ncbi:condensation protein, partial [Streptomyces sp. SID14478]|nr:condensation protein [Streptomyces sp. SID14478]